jgi:hypothetical protein
MREKKKKAPQGKLLRASRWKQSADCLLTSRKSVQQPENGWEICN